MDRVGVYALPAYRSNPNGHQLDSMKMPWNQTLDFSETELKAVRAFLLNLPDAPSLAASD